MRYARATDSLVRITETYHPHPIVAPFFVSRDGGRGPGWFVYGHVAGTIMVALALRTPGFMRHPHYNCKVRYGFRTKREAERALALHCYS